MNQHAIAYILREIALLVELTDPIPKKSLGYMKAARAVEAIDDFESAIQHQELENIPFIGATTSKMITFLARGLPLPYYEELKAKIPIDLIELTYIPGLNPRKVRLLYEKLHISSFAELKEALEKGQIEPLKIMPPSSVEKLRKHIAYIQKNGFELLYAQALLLAQSFMSNLKSSSKLITITGSLRRKCPLIAQLQFVVVAADTDECASAFTHHPAVKQVLDQDTGQVKVRLKNGLLASLNLASAKNYAYAVLLDTGSKSHVQALMREAREKKITFKRSAASEIDIYQNLGLVFIPPELRENLGEIEAAKQNSLPLLIEEKDLKGAFHCHTIESDGIHTIEQMVEGARQLGWEYIGISDHSKSSYQVNGLNEERLFSQIERIQKLNQKTKKFRIFSGIECDILKDGSLDFSNDVLKCLDFVIVSIHSFFKMDRKEMTKRLLKAIENPYTTMVAHLTGRLLRHRDPYLLDVDKIIDACIVNGKIIELNSSPSRLDMDWRYWIKVRGRGLLSSINPDAHSIGELHHCQYGVQIARKGWLEKKDVVNTMPLKAMISFLKNKK